MDQTKRHLFQGIQARLACRLPRSIGSEGEGVGMKPKKPRKLNKRGIKIEKWKDCDLIFIETKDRAFIELDKDQLFMVAFTLLQWSLYFYPPDYKGKK